LRQLLVYFVEVGLGPPDAGELDLPIRSNPEGRGHVRQSERVRNGITAGIVEQNREVDAELARESGRVFGVVLRDADQSNLLVFVSLKEALIEWQSVLASRARNLEENQHNRAPAKRVFQRELLAIQGVKREIGGSFADRESRHYFSTSEDSQTRQNHILDDKSLGSDGGFVKKALACQAFFSTADSQDVSVSSTLTSAPGAPTQDFRFVARQPIVNREQQVFGYELLFRDGIENFFRAPDLEAAARHTLDSTLLMAFDVLCDGQRAFINCTRDLLLKDGITLLPSSQTVVEVLESIEPDDLVIAACERLKIAGYSIALDDYVTNDPRESMVPLVDIVKVDFERTTPKERVQLVKKYGGLRRRMLAGKIETPEQFQAARDAGFVYFQGYFFRRPEVMKAREIPANRVNYLRMLEQFHGRIWISAKWRA
jgi:EAL domain-containing protein (putative c-di-GMP-specific phosphodiesterase class I)